MNTPLPLDSIIARGFVALRDERGDRDRLHVADLTACERAVWSRRSGEPQHQPDADTLFSWTAGHAYEEILINALVAGLGPTVEVTRNARYEDARIVGHYDALIRWPEGASLMWECKSVKKYAYEKYLKEGPNEDYLVQVRTYCHLHGVDQFAVTIADRETNRYRTWHYWASDYAEAADIEALIEKYLVATDPQAPEPPALETGDPREWRCRAWCDNLGCERNKRPVGGF
jgi:hypothetical protein